MDKKKLEIIHKFEELVQEQYSGAHLLVDFVVNEDNSSKTKEPKENVYIQPFLGGESLEKYVILRIKRDMQLQEVYDNIQKAKHLLKRVSDEHKAEAEHNLQHPNLFTQMSYIWQYRKEISV